MNGITILDIGKYYIRNTGGFNIWFLISLIAAIMFLAIFIYSAITCGSNEADCFISSCFMIIAIACCVLTWRHLGGEEITVPKYKVIIDDSVNYKDFANKYEVIKQEGQIYTIVDKEELAAAEKK